MTHPAFPPVPRIGTPAALRRELVWCEGERHTLYTDAGGNLTGGIGWNFSANGIPDWAIEGLYRQAVNGAIDALDRNASWWRFLDQVRQRAMVNLCFNLGWGGLSGFHDFLAAMQAENWQAAGRALMASEWWHQVGRRGPFIRAMVETGASAGDL